MTITRYAYINTRSAAGRPTKVEFEPSDVIDVRCWTNYYGNGPRTASAMFAAPSCHASTTCSTDGCHEADR